MPTKSQPPLIAGNWKMYKTLSEALQFVETLQPALAKTTAEVFLAVPFTMIRELSEKAGEGPLKIGAQNMNDASEGAFTGEVSASMLIDAGAFFTLLGHSERRSYFKESDELISKKVKMALKHNLKVILCIGETLEEHEEGRVREVLERQILGSLAGLEEVEAGSIIIAYEPIWAIGTGLPADPAIAEEQHQLIREIFAEKWGKKGAASLKILYGGSVNPDNAQKFLAEKNIDGVLVGSASLNSEAFAKIISTFA